MNDDNLVLAVSEDGKEIRVKDYQDFLAKKDKEKLAEFIYDRLYGRYLKPFDYPSGDYRKEYKNGFAIMACCCLLIETYVSFTKKEYRSTYNKSQKCFVYFFTTEKSFSYFADGGTPEHFYKNVRCGILHNAEIKKGWTINRDKNKPYFNPVLKEINAVKFANRLKKILEDYKKRLIIENFDNGDLWLNFKNRMEDLIKSS